ATQVVTVIDNVNPTITAPANITTNATAACAVTGLTLGTPVTSDNCSVASVTNNAPSTFPLGTTTVTWTVTDGSGHTATATQTVTVVDNTNPTITAPANVTINANSACAAFNVAFGTPVTADNCSVASVSNNAPTVFPLGTTTVTWTITDGSGNTATATQTVSVLDTEDPTIVAPAALVTFTNVDCEAANVQLGTPVVTDNCTVASVTNDAPVQFPYGYTTVTWTVTDAAGNIATATQVVEVRDTVVPVTVLSPITVNLLTTGSVSITVADVNTGTYDNCGIANMTIFPSTFTCDDLGENQVLFTATDVHGNKTQSIVIVTVELSGIDLDFDQVDDACDSEVNNTQAIVPDGFTPDGDNYNDLFVIPGIDAYNETVLEIYDRFGNKVYEKAQYANDWDGTSSFTGAVLPDDTYYYILTVDQQVKQGFVYINRIH
ncbi:MAG: gliding motility-associated C-terminal domain-containing protein, partial [Flavobacteriales bacterium]